MDLQLRSQNVYVMGHVFRSFGSVEVLGCIAPSL